MSFLSVFLFSVMTVTAYAQRSPYAGKSPVGYPLVTPEAAPSDVLGNRFGDVTNNNGTTVSTSPAPLPIEALGDRALVNRFLQMPEDKRPFWLLNWQALEAQRKNPVVYGSKPGDFIDASSAIGFRNSV